MANDTENNDTITGRDIQDVIVTGTRNATTARNIPFSVSIISNSTLNEQHRQNILPTLTEQVPGLFVTQRGMLGYGVSTGAAGAINMRGISAGNGQLLILIDGHPQYQGVFGHSISDSYQTMMAERVEVLRGPASVLYGSNAMGGVVNIITRGAKKDGVYTNISLGAGSWGTIEAEASNMLRKGKFSSTVALQYSRTDNHRPNMGFEQYGGFIKLGYDFSQHWNAFADINITHFNSSYPGSTSAPMLEAIQWITRGVATLGLEHHYDKANGRISIYDNFGFHKINDGYSAKGGKPQTELFHSKDALAGVSWYETLTLLPGNSITIGADYQHIYGRAYYKSRTTGEIVTAGKRKMQSAHAHSNEIAGYIDVKQDVTRWLTIDAGVRYDYHNVAGGEWIPQAGIVARPMNNGEIRVSASKGFRNPTTKDLYLYGTANEELKAERLWNYEISWKHHLLKGALTYGVNLFLINGDNILAQGPNNKFYNTGKIKNRGAEIEAAWRINSHWSVNTNHSFLHMDKHVLGAPEYKGYIGGNMNYGKWSATLGLQQLSGLFTEVGKSEKKTYVTLLNATVNYQLMKQLQLWVKGDNLLARKYEINAGYPMPRATFMAGVRAQF
ncbi:MAG: TonB-dependent receptor [Prevotella sp.]|nr:TonB-dependent receptor [Candidatus Prevotella equi]